jgi:hypothetical protein
MILCIIGSVLILAIVAMLIALARANSSHIEPEEKPGADVYYDYGEPPYNSYKYN